MVEQEIEQVGEGAERRVPAGKAKTARSVRVNLRESPLTWLAARGLVTPRQLEAGERLRADHEAAALGARVTMTWSPRVDGGRGGGSHGLTASERQQAAKTRFDGAIRAAGPGLADVLWRVVCDGGSLPEAERALGWPTRSGRLVLTLALDRVADHYGLR